VSQHLSTTPSVRIIKSLYVFVSIPRWILKNKLIVEVLLERSWAVTMDKYFIFAMTDRAQVFSNNS